MTFALWTLVIGVLLSRPEARPAPIEPGLAVAAAPGLRVHDADRGNDRRGRGVVTRSAAGRSHPPGRDSRPHRPGTCNCLRFGLTGEGGLNDGTAFPFVMLGLLGAPISRDQRVMIAWFGIRGIGSIYYLMYAIDHDLPRPLAEQITAITLAAMTVSIVLHGISVRPMMHLYWKRTVR